MTIKRIITTRAALLGATLLLGLVAMPLQAKKKCCEGKIMKLRIGSYNIRHAEGMDNKLDLERTASVFNRMEADVIAVQELDSFATRSNRYNELGDFGAMTGMFPTYAGSIPFQGGRYGVGILSKLRPLSVSRIPLPGKEERRVLVVTEFENYAFACTHLSLTESSRMESLPILDSVAASYKKPFFIAGDWNDEPSSPFIQALKERFQICSRTDLMTFPADNPTIMIDYIAVYKGAPKAASKKAKKQKKAKMACCTAEDKVAVTLRSEVYEEKVTSDHRPILVEVAVKAPSKKK